MTASQLSTSGSSTPAQQKNDQLLLVLDDAAVQRSVAAHLRAHGWSIAACQDAVGAQRQARDLQPAIILIGERLPGGGPLTAINRLKRNVHTAAIPIVGVLQSGSADVELLATADCCVSLDMEGSQICQIIDEQLGRSEVPLTAPRDPICDPDRIATLESTDFLSQRFDPEIDLLTQIAASVLSAPVALLSLVDRDRQYFKSHVGLDEPWASRRETDLSHSFCQWVVSGDESVIVDDAATHPVLQRNLAVHDLGVSAYAGVPVRSDTGHTLGSMCAIDSKPRHWTDADQRTLSDLSSLIVSKSLATTDQISAAQRPKASRTILQGIRGGISVLQREWSRLSEAQRRQLVLLVDYTSERLLVLSD